MALAALLTARVAQRLDLSTPRGNSVFFGLSPAEEQLTCEKVIRGRYGTEPWRAHHRSFKELKAKKFTQCANPDLRRVRMQHFGFDFDPFFDLLYKVRYGKQVWSMPGWLCDELDPTVTLKMWNLLNGNVEPDYKALLRNHGLYFLERLKAQSANFAPSTIDAVGALTLERLLLGFGEATARPLIDLAVGTLDTSLGNAAHVALYQELVHHRAGDAAFGERLRRAARALELPLDHPQRFDPFVKQGTTVDLLLPLVGFGFTQEAQWARVLAHWFRDSILLPVGFKTPHEMKTLKQELASYTEADLTIATARIEKLLTLYGGIPDMQLPPAVAPIDPERILAPKTQSFDTMQNAVYSRIVIEALAKELGRKPVIVLIVSPSHSARAYAEFLNALRNEDGELIAEILVYVCPIPGPELHMGEKLSMVFIMNMIAEYIKRLYMICLM